MIKTPHRTHHTIPCLAALLGLLALPGVASADAYGVNLSVDKSAGDFGIDVSAVAGIAAINTDAECANFWDMYDDCIDMFTPMFGATMAEAMCMPQQSMAQSYCDTYENDERTYYYARAYLDTDTELFGDDIDLLRLYGGGGMNIDGGLWGKVYAKVLGVTVDSWSKNDDALINMNKDLLSITVAGASAKASFSLAGIKVKVEAEAGGTMGVTLSGTVDTHSASATVTPSATIGASCSASVDVVVASFGISGDATLLEVGTPATAEIVHNSGTRFTVNYSLDYYWEALSGSIEVFVKVLGIRYDETIIKSNGFSGDDTLYANSFSFTL